MKCGKKSKVNEVKEEKETTKQQQSISEFRELVGDGIRLSMQTNSEGLWIKGDGCRLKVKMNRGLLRVSGDGCRVQIAKNLGKVEYFGDGGHVTLGPESNLDQVSYRGDGGIVEAGQTCDCGGEKIEKKSKGISVRSTSMQNGKLVTKVTNVVQPSEIKVLGTNSQEGTPMSVHVKGVHGRSLSIRPGKIVYHH